MGFAAKIIQPEPEEQFRHMIHDEVDKWVDQIVEYAFKDDRQLTVMELSELFAKTKQQFFGACFQALIEQKHTGLLEQEHASCPTCGKIIYVPIFVRLPNHKCPYLNCWMKLQNS